MRKTNKIVRENKRYQNIDISHQVTKVIDFFFKNTWKTLGRVARAILSHLRNINGFVTIINFHFVFQSHFLYITYYLSFEHLKDAVMVNIWRIKVQFHAMGMIANNVQYWWLVVVICNPKISQPNCDLDNSLWSKSPNNTCNYCCGVNTTTLQKSMYTRQWRMMEHNTISLYVGVLVWSQRKDFIIFQNNWDCAFLLQTMN